ncbi:two-component system regulatory protein YycI [Ferroacidibacillus organovorans]|uniref:Regulatory protein YycH-like domain-containing protein n=1 Tax=Ferroacidibacillus organovorans TaxID=1765683 RepID=A0A162UPJ3_9BACL|nr:two-component system regulatory protein YycI [Ferroacidibacillus organovorans]KYP81933.1 hypothetical protein AYJ22_05275 [Ferroacidibacillus organovorans]OAG94908.1 hypothetical protein AYW79_02630 [Ferroacidibacillus organovorans]OPG15014.1 hypothetical protein B2M26_14375 [Ferroacidibacillus organovorans]
MDFGRVKAILTVVFLLLNAFLIPQWLYQQMDVGVYAQQYADQLASIRADLAQHNVQLHAVVPLTDPQMSQLRVIPDHTSVSVLAQSIFGVHDHIRTLKSGVISGTGGKLQMMSAGLFRVTFKPPQGIEQGFLKGDLAKRVKSIIDKHGYNTGDYQLLRVEGGKVQHNLLFAQMFGGYPDFSNLLRAQVDRTALTDYLQSMVDVQQTYPPRTVMSALSALLSMVSYMDKMNYHEDNSIIDMRLGYVSFITSNQGYVLAPVWRIATLKQVFYVHAFSGEVGVGNIS